MNYAEIDVNDVVVQVIGPCDVAPVKPGFRFVPITTAIVWADQKTPTTKLLWPKANASPAWTETATVSVAIVAAIATIDRLGDAARTSAIGDPTRAIEYKRAEDQARPFAAQAYLGAVPEMVTSWANAKKWANGGVAWTPKQSADDIIATANRWNAALESIRSLRLDAKEHARVVTTVAEIDTILSNFRAALTATMTVI
jgi:hypothetical protein